MKRILIVLLLIALLLPLVSCGKKGGGTDTAEEAELKCTVRLTEFDSPVSTLTKI